jgi:hypothetical protein
VTDPERGESNDFSRVEDITYLPEWLFKTLNRAHNEIEADLNEPILGRHINDGYCRDFAKYVLEHSGHREDELTVYSFGFYHTWVEYQGYCLDAEKKNLEITSPHNLPSIQRIDVEFQSDHVITGFPTDEDRLPLSLRMEDR